MGKSSNRVKTVFSSRKSYPKLVQDWSEVLKEVVVKSFTNYKCSLCGLYGQQNGKVWGEKTQFPLRAFVEFNTYIDVPIRYNFFYDEGLKELELGFHIPKGTNALIICPGCLKLLPIDRLEKQTFRDWVKAGIPESIVRLFARREITEVEMLKLFSVYNRGIDRWANIICEIVEKDLVPKFFKYNKPFDACIRLKEFEEFLHVDEIELLLRTNSDEKHFDFLQALVGEERFEFLVEGFYDDVLLLNNTYLLESKTGILSLEHVSVEKWISFFQYQYNGKTRKLAKIQKKEVEFLNELLSKKEFHDVAEKIHDKSISISEALDLYYFRGFSKHPNALMEVIEGANWKAVAVKNGFYEF